MWGFFANRCNRTNKRKEKEMMPRFSQLLSSSCGTGVHTGGTRTIDYSCFLLVTDRACTSDGLLLYWI